MKKQTVLQLTIDSLNKKGNGAGMAIRGETTCKVEVPFSMPGDQVQTTINRKRSGVYSGRLEELIVPSPQRIAHRCLHFGDCGGCRWQHISYSQQLEIKRTRLSDLFRPLIDPSSIPAVFPCDPPWNHRNKMEFTFSQNKAGERFLGLIKNGSQGKVLNLLECHLTNPWMVDLIKKMRQWWEISSLEAFNPHKNTGSLRYLTVREGMRTGDRMVILTVSGNPLYALRKDHLRSFVELMKETFMPEQGELSLFLKIHQALPGQKTQFFEMHLHGPTTLREKMLIEDGENRHELLFYISPAAFFQPNTYQAEKLYSLALQKAQITKEDLVYDLYCGTATLAICAAKTAREVVGIEISPEAVLDGKENVKANGLNNVTIRQGDVGLILKQLQIKPDVVFVDPPRVGLMAEAIEALLTLKPKKIVYISCNPATQKENIDLLVQGGYRLVEICPVDQFPHTVHLENIAVLERNDV